MASDPSLYRFPLYFRKPGHPAELQIGDILGLLPDNTVITGLWIQNPTDDTAPRWDKSKVRISLQWKSHWGYHDSMAASGRTVAEASEGLVRMLYDRFRATDK